MYHIWRALVSQPGMKIEKYTISNVKHLTGDSRMLSHQLCSSHTSPMQVVRVKWRQSLDKTFMLSNHLFRMSLLHCICEVFKNITSMCFPRNIIQCAHTAYSLLWHLRVSTKNNGNWNYFKRTDTMTRNLEHVAPNDPWQSSRSWVKQYKNDEKSSQELVYENSPKAAH